MSKRIAVLVELDTNDPLLCADPPDTNTIDAAKRLRAAVVAALPGLVGVVAVMPIEMARAVMQAHDEALRDSGLAHIIRHPPLGYKNPGGR